MATERPRQDQPVSPARQAARDLGAAARGRVSDFVTEPARSLRPGAHKIRSALPWIIVGLIVGAVILGVVGTQVGQQ